MTGTREHLILVVDDDADIRDALAEYLEDEGYTVERASNGQEALGRLRGSTRPCVILLDLMMPVMDGFQFRAEQQQDAQLASIPVIVISAGSDCENAAQILGAHACVKKPLALNRLLGAIEQVC